MAELTAFNPLSSDITAITKVDLSVGPHTFTYSSFKQCLYVENGEISDVTVNITGDGVITHKCPEYGDIDVSAGFDWVVTNANNEESLYTLSKGAFLGENGNTVTITATGATGLSFVYLAEY